MKQYLKCDHRFLGCVRILNELYCAIIELSQNMELNIFIPYISHLGRNIEKENIIIEGKLHDWNVKCSNLIGKVSYSWIEFDDISLNIEEKNYFQEKYNKLESGWTKIIGFPSICTFTKIELANCTPDEWGITFLKESGNSLKYLSKYGGGNSKNLPNIFFGFDNSLYFNNSKLWKLDDILKRIKIIIGSLSLFTCNPLDYESIIGRYKGEVLCIQFKLNYDNFISPNIQIVRVEVKSKSTEFLNELINKIESIFKRDTEYKRKIKILFSYFRLLHMQSDKNLKIAFSYLLMESLAKFKDLTIEEHYFQKKTLNRVETLLQDECNYCSNLSIILPELNKLKKQDINGLIEYINCALKVINIEIEPELIKEIIKKYRNNVMHGDFFSDFDNYEKFNKLPEVYQSNFFLISQAIVFLIAINFILDIDFEQLVVYKTFNSSNLNN